MFVSRQGEKEFLKELHRKRKTLEWREDCIIRPVTDDLSIVYSIDSAERKICHDCNNDPKVYGRWVAAVVASDIIACGVLPKGLSLDIGINAFTDEQEICRFVEGVKDVCTEYGMEYEGGNINRSTLTCGVSWGLQKTDSIIHREGAKDGSILIATAPIGLGWAYYMYKKMSLPPPDMAILEKATNYKKTFLVNLKAFQEIWALQVIECGMDLTDGIVEFGYEIFERTGLGVVFTSEKMHPFVNYVASKLNVPPQDFLYDPGYDTPLAHGWCISESSLESVIEILNRYEVPHTILGRVSNSISGVYRRTANKLHPLPRFWDDKFSSESNITSWYEKIVNTL